MTRSQLILTATAGSIALLGGAFVFQLLGYAPCKMCYWQRWPHALAIFMGALALVQPKFQRGLAALGACAAGLTGLIGIYHAGVEQKWWEGPTSCTGSGASLENVDLLSTDIAPIVLCDEIVWSLMGITMAGFNAIFSLVLVTVWIKAAKING